MSENVEIFLPSIRGKYQSHSVAYKLEAVKYSEENSICKTSKKFNVSRSTIREWKRNRTHLEDMVQSETFKDRLRITKRSVEKCAEERKNRTREKSEDEILNVAAADDPHDVFKVIDAYNNGNEYCANCAVLLSTGKITYLKCHDPFRDDQSDIQITDALALVFEIEWDNFFVRIQNEYERNEKITPSGITKCEVVLCKNCASVLDDIYTSYCSFIKLMHQKSLIKLAKIYRNIQSEPQDKSFQPVDDTPEEANFPEDNNDLFQDFHFEEDIPMSDHETKQDIKCDTSRLGTEQDNDMSPVEPDVENAKRLVIKLDKLPRRELPMRKYKGKIKYKKLKKTVNKDVAKPEKPKYECNDCGKTFSLKTQLNLHSRLHRPTVIRVAKPKKGSFPCYKCGKVLKDARYVRKHERLVHGNHTAKCDKCDKILKNTATLRYHLKTVHASEDEREKQKICCNICGKKLFATTLKYHMVSHTKVKEQFNCDKCEKIFNSEERLQYHIEAHYSTKVHNCKECGKGFPIEQYMKEHIERYHNTTKPYGCDECPKRFKTKRLIMMHKATHSAIKEFVCEECGKACSSQTHLNQHLQCHRDEELGPDAFRCPDCSKSFKNRFCLRSHQIRSHRTDLVAGKRIFCCTICGKSLYDERNLKKHMEAVHSDKPRSEPRKINEDINLLQYPILPMTLPINLHNTQF